MDVDQFLEHHGVKGQKWGIRNDKRTLVGRGRKGPSTSGPSGHLKKASIQVDETPWSNYKESDYTPAQWHRASLIHDHPAGTPTTKNHCKLPVKTPNGVVNRHGVYAAAAVLAGSRGGVNASAAQKNSAAAALLRIYSQMGAEPPPSLRMKHSDADDIYDFLEHFGVRGMHWGIHNEKDYYRRGKARRVSGESKKVSELRKRHPSSLTNKQLEEVNKRLNLEQNYRRLNPTTVDKGKKFAEVILGGLAAAGVAELISHPQISKAAIEIGKKALRNL